MYLCIYVFMYLCIYVFMYLCIYVFMYLCIYVFMYLCIYVFMYLCIYVLNIDVLMYLCMHLSGTSQTIMPIVKELIKRYQEDSREHILASSVRNRLHTDLTRICGT